MFMQHVHRECEALLPPALFSRWKLMVEGDMKKLNHAEGAAGTVISHLDIINECSGVSSEWFFSGVGMWVWGRMLSWIA